MDRLLTPQQEKFLAQYTNPKSETFGNALQSGLKAGYSQEYSENITSQLPDWLSENLGKSKIVKKAEKNLEFLLDSDDEKIMADMTKFALKTLGKKDYSERTELTGENGVALEIKVINYGDNNTTQV